MQALNILFVAHGSTFETYQTEAEDFVAAWRNKCGLHQTKLCYLEMIHPNFKETLQQLDVPTIVVPLFLHEGWHMRKDISDAISASTKAVTILPPLTSHLALMAVVEDRLAETKSGHDAVIIYSHGNRATEKQIHLVKLALEFEVKTGFKCTVVVSKGEPSLRSELCSLVEKGKKRITILPHFLFSGVWKSELDSQIRALSLSSDVQITIAKPLGNHPALLSEICTSLTSLE